MGSDLAERHIAKQRFLMREHGVTGMTRKQRARVNAGRAILDQSTAIWLHGFSDRIDGRPPDARTGFMRVLDLRTGGVTVKHVPVVAPRT
jgi:hypothetical protein